jgi:poly(3-hydroxyalkanoate) depolymerase
MTPTQSASADNEAGTEIISVRGQDVRVRVREGDGKRPPLLLMNGLGVKLEGLQPLVDQLPSTTRVIRFDVPGTGASPTPSLPYRLTWVSWLVAGILRELGHSRADVLGASWGGALAQHFAFQQRRRCRRLILVSTGPGFATVPGRPSVLREVLSSRRHEDPVHARNVAPRLYGGALRTDPDSYPLLGDLSVNPRGLLYQQLAVLGWTSLPFVRFIRQPTLILTGADDPIIHPVNGRIMRWLLPNAELRTFNDGHLGLLTSATELAPMVEEFLQRP